MKIELSIKTDYLPTWGVWEGLRELVQNGLDAETEFNAPLDISYYNETVRIENEGVTLPYEALLLGHTTKLGRSEMIGKFGEGLKLGLLALVRSGRDVRLRSGGEVWVPAIERSSKFNADVLVVNISKGRSDKNRVRVEVSGVSKEEWGNIKERFLFLAKPTKNEKIATDEGDLLLGDRFRHRIYVKGVYVQNDSKLNYGYNYWNADLDRDRKMVDSWDKQYRNGRIWQSAVASRPDLLDNFYALLSEGKSDTEGMSGYAGETLPLPVAERVAEKFSEQFGEDAVPVDSLEQSRELEHLGKKGIVVSKAMKTVVEKKIGSIETVAKQLREEVVRRYSWHELESDDRNTLDRATSVVYEAAENPGWSKPEDVLREVDVVDFRSDNLLGQFKDGKYLIARKLLADEPEFLATLIHEVAHAAGGDGEHRHIAEIERIWKGVYQYLRRTK